MDVDSCEPCGVLWLDRGELSRIVAAPDRDPRDGYESAAKQSAANQDSDADKSGQPQSKGNWLFPSYW
jgi:Zn-finger nucleic acid-binding protein